MNRKKIIIIAGPTASGKTKLALKLAEKFDSVIINADSQQVYASLPVLTAQPTAQEREQTPHYLFGYVSVIEDYSVGRWLNDAVNKINDALSADITPILVGGTGLYIKCLMKGMAAIPDVAKEIRDEARKMLEEIGNKAFYKMLNARDPAMGEKLKPGDSQRILRAWEVLEQTNVSLSKWQKMDHKKFFEPEIFEGYFLNPPREEVYNKINNRFVKMMENGALEEVKNLIENNPPKTSGAWKSLGVPELSAYLKGEITLEEAVAKAQQTTRNYAKRQVTWFRHQLPDLKEIASGDMLLG